MKFRITKRKYSPNIIEVLEIVEGKEKWIPFMIPVRIPKKVGDADAELVFNQLTKTT